MVIEVSKESSFSSLITMLCDASMPSKTESTIKVPPLIVMLPLCLPDDDTSVLSVFKPLPFLDIKVTVPDTMEMPSLPLIALLVATT